MTAVTFNPQDTQNLQDAILQVFDLGGYYIFAKVAEEDVDVFDFFAKESGLDAQPTGRKNSNTRLYQVFF